MKTQEEILQKIENVKDEDIFRTITNDLLVYLEFDKVKPFLKDCVTEEQWGEMSNDLTVENVKKLMIDYLPFAYEKAEGERGLSAARSMDHYYAWIWLLGEEERFGDVREYVGYGIHNLNEIKTFLSE